ncbi:MAG: PAS domain S-box protein [Lautropia sp.]
MSTALKEGLDSGPVAAWSGQLRLLLESTGDGIFAIDMAGRCIFVNRAAAESLGYRTDQVLGRNMHYLIHHSHADGRGYPEEDCPIFNAFRQGLPCRIDNEVLWRADGSPFHAAYSSYPVIDRGRVLGAVVTFVDITERKRHEDLLRQARDELERRVRDRTAELSQALGRLRDLSAHLDSVREEERTRIARDVHDELGAQLVALRMDVDWLQRRVGAEPPLAYKCAAMGRLIARAVDSVGRIINDLRPSLLDHQGLWAALEWQAQSFVESTELDGDLRFHVADAVQPPGGVAGERWAIAVFRIFQEMLSNVARHARARHVAIRLYVDGPPQPVLYLEVRDDGVGAGSAALHAPNSYGMLGMRERAGHFGGHVVVGGVAGRGTRVRLSLPLPAQSAAAGTSSDVRR